MSKAQQIVDRINEKYGNNWDQITDFFGEQIANHLAEACYLPTLTTPMPEVLPKQKETMIATPSERYLLRVAHIAEEKFWGSVSGHLPLIQSGDMNPMTESHFRGICEEMVEEWVKSNIKTNG